MLVGMDVKVCVVYMCERKWEYPEETHLSDFSDNMIEPWKSQWGQPNIQYLVLRMYLMDFTDIQWGSAINITRWEDQSTTKTT